jgi:ATP-dependent Clp protease ATP-binding subunit ClpB
MEINSKPEELDVLDRKVMQLEIEIEAIKRKEDESKLKVLGMDLLILKKIETRYLPNGNRKKT